jgi:hypothetical protein
MLTLSDSVRRLSDGKNIAVVYRVGVERGCDAPTSAAALSGFCPVAKRRVG